MEALNALDLEEIAQYFADDITAFVPSAQAERAEGKAAVVEIFRRYVETTRATTARTNLVPEDLRIDVQGGAAVVSFHVRSADAVAPDVRLSGGARGSSAISMHRAFLSVGEGGGV